ncbi:MAG: Fur family transcriptional regulator, stress-responsive regulator [Actinomycetota bacterium]|jgi:Fur family ferric uptake transcriptional regulator|nr:Fur family transcriptional regulator, stress-responsive regulator [Actinomycetota bacterium]
MVPDNSASVGRIDPATHLRSAGLRVTAPRLAAYDAVVDHPHADADDIATAVRDRLGKASTQGVYDALRVLTEQGLVRRIEPAGSPARFEARTGDNHHHVVCRRCGTVGDVDCAVNETPCLEASQTHGFTIDEAEVTYWGLCPTCQEHQEGTA